MISAKHFYDSRSLLSHYASFSHGIINAEVHFSQTPTDDLAAND